MRDEHFVMAGLAAAIGLLAAEVRRAARERDTARREFEGLVGRLAERPTTVLMAAPAEGPMLSPTPPYVSDLPYMDEVWDEFAKVNETIEEEE